MRTLRITLVTTLCLLAATGCRERSDPSTPPSDCYDIDLSIHLPFLLQSNVNPSGKVVELHVGAHVENALPIVQAAAQVIRRATRQPVAGSWIAQMQRAGPQERHERRELDRRPAGARSDYGKHGPADAHSRSCAT